MIRLFVGVALVLGYTGIFAAPTPTNRQLATDYIARFSQLAVIESLRSGVPASIKLAQGMHESNYGQSQLALASNNHFGIKWTKNTEGGYVEAFDDEYRKGQKVKSKFMRFNSPEESYQYHTNFLMQGRYQGLLKLDRADYRAWAYGLKEKGYATDPQYAEKIIHLIEFYNLDQYDFPTQLSLDDTTENLQSDDLEEEEVIDFYEITSEIGSKPNGQRVDVFPSEAERVETQERSSKVENHIATRPPHKTMAKVELAEEEEEHILFEILPEPTTKSAAKKQRQNKKK